MMQMKQIERECGVIIWCGCFPISEDAIFDCVTQEFHSLDRVAVEKRGILKKQVKKKKRKKIEVACECLLLHILIHPCVYNRSISSRNSYFARQ